MSSPLPPNTHTAPCPSCGATLTSGVGGYLWMACGMCSFRGQVMMQPAGQTTSNPARHAAQGMPPTWTPPVTTPPPGQITITTARLMAAFGITDPSDDDQPAREPTAEERWRDALRQHINEMAASVCGAMRDLTDADWRLGIEQVYERVQAAHGELYGVLGARRMGDYAPGRVALDGALVKALLWQVMLLHAAERMREER